MLHNSGLTVPQDLREEYILFIKTLAKKREKRLQADQTKLEELRRSIAYQAQSSENLDTYARENGIVLSSD